MIIQNPDELAILNEFLGKWTIVQNTEADTTSYCYTAGMSESEIKGEFIKDGDVILPIENINQIR